MTNPIEFNLMIHAPDIDDEKLDDLTRFLVDDLRNLDLEDVQRVQSQASLQEGAKGDFSTLGALMLVAAPAAIPGIMAFLQTWVLRSENRQITIKTTTGLEVTFSPEKKLTQEEILTLTEKLQAVSQNPRPVETAPTTTAYNRQKFRAMLAEYFNESELKIICFDLGIDYEELSGMRKSEKVIELLIDLERQDRMTELIELVRVRRPNVSWLDVMTS